MDVARFSFDVCGLNELQSWSAKTIIIHECSIGVFSVIPTITYIINQIHKISIHSIPEWFKNKGDHFVFDPFDNYTK